ncbi:glycosyltransferase family 4 protein [Candidatus Woesearchaeota archaeon]|nr:glycosyltransferase family 4 protein [Candidatus Woesearchaeota archaeon]
MNKKLRIAQIAPLAERVPPKRYGGTERVVHALTESLVKRGHEVTLFASGDSITSARLVSVYPRALREARIKDPHGMNTWILLNIAVAYKRQAEFDIIHDHNGIFSIPTAQFATTPTVFTIHGPITPYNRRLFETVSNPSYVSISKAQTSHVPNLKIAAIIPNGLNMKDYPFCSANKGYLLFVGRISMEKGVHYAIDAAADLNIPLVIAAKLDDEDVEYFKEYVKPRLYGEQVKWIGEVDEQERNKLMSEALACLHPATWREPFGLTIIEAMACGCPVIAFNKGSIPEIIVNGKTGFVVNDVDEMIDTIPKIDRIDRKECRRHALENFNDNKMTDAYERLYYTLIRR